MSPSQSAAIETREHHDRAVRAYLASGRNADLPLSVRTWIAEGEGSDQDEIESIQVSDVVESEELSRGCEGCWGNLELVGDLEDGLDECYRGGRVVVEFRESASCNRTRVVLNCCQNCCEDWDTAREAVEARPENSGDEAALLHGLFELANAGRCTVDIGQGYIRIGGGPGVSSVRFATVGGFPVANVREMVRRIRGAA